MLKKLRLKFIASNMLLVGIIIISVFAALFFVMYSYEKQQSISALTYVLEHNTGSMDLVIGNDVIANHEMNTADLDSPNNKVRNVIMVVQTDANGNVISSAISPTVTISSHLMSKIIRYAGNYSGECGSIPDYNLRFLKVSNSFGGYNIGIADTSAEATTLAFISRVFILCAIFILSIMFLISDYMAHKAIAPVEKSWSNQNRFVADASHELKTPLTVILANMDIMSANPNSTIQEQEKWIENTKSEAKRMTQLVNDMLFLAKSDAAVQQIYNFADVNFSSLTEDCTLTFESVAFEKGIELNVQIEPDLYVCADEAKLKQSVIVLIDNALKYVGDLGTITVSLQTSGKNAKLDVTNTGCPIPQEKQRHIFERFFRADESRARDKGGYGLGLSIASNIVEVHKGKLVLEYSNAEGTCFSMTLPLKSPPQKSLGIKKRK